MRTYLLFLVVGAIGAMVLPGCRQATPPSVPTYPTAMGKELAVFVPHLAPPASRLSPDPIAISPDAKLVAIGTSIGIIKVWQIESGNLVAEIPVSGKRRLATCLAFSAGCGFKMVYLQEFGVENKSWPALAELDLQTQQVSKDWWKEAWGGPNPPTNPLGWLQCVAFSPDSKTLAVGGEYGVALWDVASKKLKSILWIPLPEQDSPRPDRYQAWSLSFSPDGSLLAAGAGPSPVYKAYLPVWQVSTGKLVQKVKTSGTVVAFAPAGKTLAVGSTELQLYDVATWERLFSFEISFGGQFRSCCSLVYSSDGQRLAFAEDHAVAIEQRGLCAFGSWPSCGSWASSSTSLG